MNKPAVNDGKANAAPRAGRSGQSPRAACPVARTGASAHAAASAAGGRRLAALPRRHCRRVARRLAVGPGRQAAGVPVAILAGCSLSWSLRWYVRASRPRVWLFRQAPGGSNAVGRDSVRRARGGQSAAAGRRPGASHSGSATEGRPPAGAGAQAASQGRTRVIGRPARAGSRRQSGGCPPVPPARPGSGSGGPRSRVWHHLQGNGQNEYFTQHAAGTHGGVRRGAAIAARESGHACHQGLTTLSNKTSVQSNIFGFVMT